jgi:hypothetical protein
LNQPLNPFLVITHEIAKGSDSQKFLVSAARPFALTESDRRTPNWLQAYVGEGEGTRQGTAGHKKIDKPLSSPSRMGGHEE